MDSGANFPAKTPTFTGVNYGVWAVKMETYLKAFDLWEYVEKDKVPTPLNNNPTVAQMKFFNEERAKGFKALTGIHNAVSEEIFTRIMTCKTAKEAWDKLKAEFQGDEKSRRMQVMNLRRQFEALRMRETDTIKDFSSQISKLVNQVRLLGEDFPDSRIVEKVLVSLPDRFEHKICSLEDSKDFSEISLQELINALQSVEERHSYRHQESSGEALVAKVKDKHHAKPVFRNNFENRREKGSNWKPSNWQPFNRKGNTSGVEKREDFPPCKYCKKTNHRDSWCWLKNIQCRRCKEFGHMQKFCKKSEVARIAQTEEDAARGTRSLAEIYSRCNVADAEPIGVEEALKSQVWIAAMKEELAMIENNKTWKLVDRPRFCSLFLEICSSVFLRVLQFLSNSRN